jgi:hypothetical protein
VPRLVADDLPMFTLLLRLIFSDAALSPPRGNVTVPAVVPPRAQGRTGPRDPLDLEAVTDQMRLTATPEWIEKLHQLYADCSVVVFLLFLANSCQFLSIFQDDFPVFFINSC